VSLEQSKMLLWPWHVHLKNCLFLMSGVMYTYPFIGRAGLWPWSNANIHVNINRNAKTPKNIMYCNTILDQGLAHYYF